MKARRSAIILVLLFAVHSAGAAELQSVSEIRSPSLFLRMVVKVRECTWRIPCYFEGRLGAGSLTTVTGSTLLSDLDTILTNNNTYFDERKVNIASTTWPQLTTTANLTTVGTIISGTWQGSVIDVARQGTGSTSPTANLVILGNGASGFKTVNSSGVTGSVLVAQNGAAPIWGFGIGTDTPSSLDMFGIQNNVNISGALHVASITATGTITWNKITYTAPSSQGAAGSLLQNNGSGGLSWGSASLSSERALATSTAAIAVQSASSTRLVWATEIFDPSNRLDSNGRFSVSEAGAYFIEGIIGFSPDAGMTSDRVMVYVDGKEIRRVTRASISTTAAFTTSFNFVLQLAAGQTIEIWAASTDGGATPKYCSGASNECELHIQKLHD